MHVLFVCLQNAGRSQMSRALFERAANGRPAGSGIERHGWLVDSTLTGTVTENPRLHARAQAESTHLARVAQLSERCTFSVAWQRHAPTGMDALRTLATDPRAIASARP